MTSATFCFLSEHPAPTATTLYIHLDCDPAGAANYLRAMLGTGTDFGAVAFIRANFLAQLVCGHNVWPNTSYRYTISENRLLVEERLEMFEEGWERVFEGLLVDFLNAQPGHRLFTVALHAGDPVGHYTACQLASLVSSAQGQLMQCDQAGDGTGMGRAQQRVDRLKAIQRAAHQVEARGELIVA